MLTNHQFLFFHQIRNIQIYELSFLHQGLILSGKLTQKDLTLVPVPIESKNLKPQLLRGVEKQNVLNHICKNIMDKCTDGKILINLEKS